MSYDAQCYYAIGTSESIFYGLSIGFDDGTGNTYHVHRPDVLTPTGGSTVALQYSLTGEVPQFASRGDDHRAACLQTGIQEDVECAAVQYDGVGKVVYLAFPFETIIVESIRTQLMQRVLDFFEFGGDTITPTPIPTQTPTPTISTSATHWKSY